MKNFFEWTAWEMTPPPAYGVFHLLFLFIGFSLAILLAWFLRKTTEKQNKIILITSGIVMLIAEVYKQLFYFYIVKGSYEWGHFPFQLCSIPMYLCLIIPFIKHERAKSWLYNFIFSYHLFSGIITYLEPSGMNLPYITLTLHSYIWHLWLVFLGFYLLFSKRACNDWKGFFKGSVYFVGFATIAQILNVIFKDKAGMNMFFISPYNVSPLAVFHDIYLKVGWFWNMVIYLLGLFLAAGIVYFSCFGIKKLIEKRKKNKEQTI